MSTKTIVIGLDGATFTVLDPLMERGVMPFLDSFMRSGVRAELRTIVPPLTPPAWTSLLTGCAPGQHGIFDFFQLDAPGSRQIRFASSHDVRCQSIAAIANQHGLRATVLNFPVTFPPPRLDGYVVSGWMPWKQLRLACHPTTLWDQLRQLPGFEPRELGMDMGLEARATEGGKTEDYSSWAELHTRREQQWLKVLDHLMRSDPTELVAVLFDGPDKIQHLCWRFLDDTYWPEQPAPWEQEVRERCYEYFRQLDRVLEAVVELAGPQATVIVASDHGFGATDEVFHVNAWLEQAGYLVWSDAAPASNGSSTLGMDQLARHTQWLDWECTTAYAATPTSNGIHIVTAGAQGQAGVARAEYEQFRDKLAAELLAFVDPASGTPVVSRVRTREEAFSGPAMELAPDLTLELRDGGLVSILPAEQVLKPRAEIGGTHRPNGIFLARGTSIRSGAQLSELSILDIAPTVLHSLQLPIPEQMQGRVPAQIYDPAFHMHQPIQKAAPARPEEQAATGYIDESGYDEEAEAVMLARLRDLGYVE